MEQQYLQGNAQIAMPVLVVEGEQKIKIDKNNPEEDYSFSIKNYTEETLNDVEFRYTIYFQTDIENKIDFQLEKNGEIIQISKNKTEEIIMEEGKKIEHVYHLKIETKEDSDEIIGNITIKVLATQAK